MAHLTRLEIPHGFEQSVDGFAYRDDVRILYRFRRRGREAVELGLKWPWRPQPAWPRYASTLDRCNSMDIDAIDAVVDAFEGCGRIDHEYVPI